MNELTKNIFIHFKTKSSIHSHKSNSLLQRKYFSCYTFYFFIYMMLSNTHSQIWYRIRYFLKQLLYVFLAGFRWWKGIQVKWNWDKVFYRTKKGTERVQKYLSASFLKYLKFHLCADISRKQFFDNRKFNIFYILSRYEIMENGKSKHVYL